MTSNDEHSLARMESLPSGMIDALNPKQLAAGPLVITGRTDVDVAAEIGVRRETLWRWRTQHPAFQAYLSFLKLEAHEARMDRVWTLVDRAMEVVGESLEEGDPVVAMQILRLPGVNLSDAPRRAE